MNDSREVFCRRCGARIDVVDARFSDAGIRANDLPGYWELTANTSILNDMFFHHAHEHQGEPDFLVVGQPLPDLARCWRTWLRAFPSMAARHRKDGGEDG